MSTLELNFSESVAFDYAASRLQYASEGDAVKALALAYIDKEKTSQQKDAVEGAGQAVDDPFGEWKDMPEFEQPDNEAHRKIIVNFKSDADIKAFANLIQQNITEKTRYVWYPETQRNVVRNKVYISSDEP